MDFLLIGMDNSLYKKHRLDDLMEKIDDGKFLDVIQINDGSFVLIGIE